MLQQHNFYDFPPILGESGMAAPILDIAVGKLCSMSHYFVPQLVKVGASPRNKHYTYPKEKLNVIENVEHRIKKAREKQEESSREVWH